MTGEEFVYVIYIRTTMEKLFDALTTPEFTRQYWCEVTMESDWNQGSEWKMMIPDGRVADSGKVEEIDRPRRLVLSWQNEFVPELKAEGFSRCVFELEQAKDAVKLTVRHSMETKGTKFIASVSQGWPGILSSLKTLLEGGEALQISSKWPEGM